MATQEVNVEKLKELVSKIGHLGVPFDRVKNLKTKILNNPLLYPTPARYFDDRVEGLDRHYAFMNAFLNFAKKENLSYNEQKLGVAYFNQPSPWWIHYELFVNTLKLLGDPEQIKEWLSDAEEYKIAGCYAQTELGHGSNVQGLETTADFDKENQQFVLNSPTPGSIKWWIGALGVLATHAVVFARLRIDGQDYGPHAFVLQIRDRNTHELLPGIHVGDIGPKLGYNVMDNGFMKLENVRIPRKNMLARFTRVTCEGEYEMFNPEGVKLLYGGMLLQRIRITEHAWAGISKALTIALKYSDFRRQFKTYSSDPTQERAILDYQVQQYRLLPLLADAYGMLFAGKVLYELYELSQAKAQAGDMGPLGEVHGLCSATKAWFTWWCNAGIEECRQCCGGYGYSKLSSFPDLYGNEAPGATYEGDNSILCVQSARFIFKTMKALKDGKKVGQWGTLLSIGESKDLAVLPVNSEEFQTVAIRVLANKCAEELYERVKQHGGNKESWDTKHYIVALEAAKALAILLVHESYLTTINLNDDSNIKSTLNKLRSLYALKSLASNSNFLLRKKVLLPRQSREIRTLLEDKLREIRRICIPIVDGFSFDEIQTNSALLKGETQTYETLLSWAKDFNPLNREPVFPAIKKYLKPLSRL